MKNYFSIRAILIGDFVIKHFSVVSFCILTLFLIVLSYKGAVGIDPDFGWRLRSGQLILSSGIQRTDPFSYTMSSFPWVDHAWPMSLLMAVVYQNFGMEILSILFSLIVVGIFILLLSSEKSFWYLNKVVYKKSGDLLGFLGSFPVLLAMANIFPFFGIRAQVATWLLFSVVVVFIFSQKIWEKWRLFIPVVFLVWGNLHGGFIAGLSAITLFVLFKSIRLRRFDVVNATIIISSVLATLINPYGTETWREVFSSVFDAKLRLRIIEWRPTLFNFNISFITLHTLAFVLVFRLRRLFKLEEKIVYLFFLFQGISSVRNIPLLVFVEMPLVARGIKEFYRTIKKDKGAITRFKSVYIVAWWGCLFIFLFQTTLAIIGGKTLSEEKYYPKNAVLFLRNNQVEGRLMSHYTWGGYLIWKLPEKKVFIDGRMPSWKWNAGVVGETNDAMQEYVAVTNGEVSWQETFEKYDIQAVLWPSENENTRMDNLEKRWEDFLASIGRRGKKKDFIEELETSDWNKIYEDEGAVIYQKS